MERFQHIFQQLQMTKYQKCIDKVTLISLFLFSFLLPFQIDYLIYQSPLVGASSGVHFFSSSFFHISELFLLSGVIGLLLTSTRSKKLPLSLLIASGSLLLSICLALFFAVDPYLHVLQSRYIFYGILLIWIVCSSIKARKFLLYGLIATASLQAVIIILQSVAGQSIGLHILGEPLFASDLLTTAKVQLQDTVIARPYGTMNHPNIVAAFLMISMYLSSTHATLLQKYIPEKRLLLLHILLGIAIILTLSKVVIAMTVAGFLIFWCSQKVHLKWVSVPATIAVCLLLAAVFDINSLLERIQYFRDSIAMLLTYPFGVGLGSYTSILPSISPLILQPWEVQPVHSLLLLFGNEAGILGALSLLFLLYCTWMYCDSRASFFFCTALVILSFADHYFLTSYPLSSLWWIAIGFLWSDIHITGSAVR